MQQERAVCHLLLPGYKPFQGVSYEGIAAAVLQHAIADLPNHLSCAFRSFITATLTYDPQQRPSAAQLLDHPWIKVGGRAGGILIKHQHRATGSQTAMCGAGRA